MTRKVLSAALLASVTCLALGGCAPNTTNGTSEGGIQVSSTADACEVSADTAESGTNTFTITNDGDRVTEFYLLGDDGLRIVSEQENIAPGASAQMTVSLQPGAYFTACKPGLRGANVGEAAFTVSGEAVELAAQDDDLYTEAVGSYVDFVKNEVAELVPNVEEFAQAYMDGDDERARDLFAATRVNYERIEPIAEALGTLDPRIDYREVDYLAEAAELRGTTPRSPSGSASTGWRRTSGPRRRVTSMPTGPRPSSSGRRAPTRPGRGSASGSSPTCRTCTTRCTTRASPRTSR